MRLEHQRKRIFADRLRQACVAKFGKEFGVASRLSEVMDVTIATAGRWVRGVVTPEPERWPELAQKLDVSVEWLTGASHDIPDAVAKNVDDRTLDLACTTTKTVLPVVMRLKPDISPEELNEIVRYAYHQLEAGQSEAAVSGELFSRLA
jgi:hypothetical protein